MTPLVRALLEHAGRVRPLLATVETAPKDRALASLARLLRRERSSLVAANNANVADAKKNELAGPLLDRLALDERRIERMAEAVDEVRQLPDPVGETVESWRRPNGLEVSQVRIPLGVLLVVYEARPNVTSNSAALTLKSGNAVILRGGSEALRTNQAIAALIARSLSEAGLPPDAVQLVSDPSRDILKELLSASGQINLCICRGGQPLMRFAAEHARIPVIPHAEGIVHTFVDAGVDVPKAVRILVNAKTQRPEVCNATECLLVHRDAAEPFLPEAGAALAKEGVELRCDPTAFGLLHRAGVPCVQAKESDFGREFLDKILAVRVLPDLQAALAHIARYGSGHTEAILTPSLENARRFEREVMAAAVIVNASTRFNDGGELGLGAEIGISTGRLHAYGPMGLRELCSKKYVVRGHWQVRT